MPIYTYHLSGFILKTNFYLSELTVANGTPDFEILIEDHISPLIPASLLGKSFFVDRDLSLIGINKKNSGLMAIWNNRILNYTPPKHFTSAEIKMYILGTGYMLASACLGYFSFHASCVLVNGRAVLFCGKSGVGKSTLAAYFNTKGYTVLSDDVTNIKIISDGEITIYPSLPRIKLTADALAQFGKSISGLNTIPGARTKYSLPVKHFPETKTFKLGAIVFPTFDKEEKDFSLLPLSPEERRKALGDNFYRGILCRQLHSNEVLNEVLKTISETVKMFFFVRPFDADIGGSINFIEEKLLKLISPDKNKNEV